MGLLFIVACLGSSCNSVQEKTLLKKASKIHQESVQIESTLNKKLKELVEKKNSINIQGRALSTEELTFVDIIEQLELTYQSWKENFQNSAALYNFTDGHSSANRNGAMAYNASNKTGAKSIYSSQVELNNDIIILQKEVESTYKKWINEV